MDLELELDLLELAALLREMGFEKVKIRNDLLEGIKRRGYGRIHVLAKEIAAKKFM